MKLAKVTTNGRIALPAMLRKKHNRTPRKKIKFELEEDGILITPLATSEKIENNIGFLGTRGKLLKALMREKKFECEL